MKKKKKKLLQIQDDIYGVEISRQKYNIILSLFILYGFVANVIECLLFKDLFLTINPIFLIVVYILLGITGCVIANRAKTAVGTFIGYNMLVLPLGALLSNAVYYALETSPDAVLYAFVGTIIITAIMLLLSILNPQIFLKLGKLVFWVLIAVLITELILMFVLGEYLVLFSYIMVAIMGFFIAYDFALANRVRPTIKNAVVFALNLYLDIINIFLNLLDIFSDN